jgi:hypothetical protein
MEGFPHHSWEAFLFFVRIKSISPIFLSGEKKRNGRAYFKYLNNSKTRCFLEKKVQAHLSRRLSGWCIQVLA